LNILKHFIIALSLFFSFTSIIEANDKLEDLENPLANFQISKDEIKSSLQKLRSEGKISENDYNKALTELNGMNEGQISAMKDAAIQMVRKDPDKASELAEVKQISSNKELEGKVKELTNP